MLKTDVDREDVPILEKCQVPFSVIKNNDYMLNRVDVELDGSKDSLRKLYREKERMETQCCKVVNLIRRIEKVSQQTA